MERPQRRPNRLEAYDYSQSGAYFVTICTQGRRRILSDIVGDDAHIVPKPCGKILEKYFRNAPEIEKYVIMPDHVHMIIRLEGGTMWASSPTAETEGVPANRTKSRAASIVRSIKTLTTKEIGEAIFQRSYYDHVIRNQQDYRDIWEYIEANPKKWINEKQGRA